MSGFVRVEKKLMALSPRQEKVLSALLTEPSRAAAAKVAQVDEKTVRRYLQEPEFAAAYSEGRRQLVQDALGVVSQGAVTAAAVLRVIMSDAKIPASVRVRAAVAVLDLAVQQCALADVEQRLLTLERQLALVEETRAHPR